MHIAVDVSAGNPKDGQYRETTHCIIIFVAVDETGKPVEVTPWKPQTEEETALQQYAVRLMDLRRSIEDEMRPHRGS